MLFLSNLLFLENLHLPANIMCPCDINNILFEIFPVTRGIEHISGTSKKEPMYSVLPPSRLHLFEGFCRHVVNHCNSKIHMR